MHNHKAASRKTQILEAMADMLGRPHSARITTAALARHLNLSEGALYRHFSGKAALFENLILGIEAQLNEDLSHISLTEPDPRKLLHKQVHALLLFAERHPGLTRVLTGDALATEDQSLQENLNSLIARIQAIVVHSAREVCRTSSVEDENRPYGGTGQADAMANVLMHWVMGRWLRYAQTSWRVLPTQDYTQQLALLGL